MNQGRAMEPKVMTEGDYCVVKPVRDIRVQTLVQLRNKLERVLDKRPEKVALDLGDVHYIDSSGIGLLMNLAKKIRAYRGEFVIFNYDDEMRDLLEVANVTDNITCRAKLQEFA